LAILRFQKIFYNVLRMNAMGSKILFGGIYET